MNTAIGLAAGIIAMIAPAAPALADDTVPVIDMGTFENSYEPTDSWIKDGWEYEKKDDYIVLKKYTGDDAVVEVPGKVTISGTEYKVKICDETFAGNNRITEVDFKAVDGQKVTVEGNLNGAFSGDTLLKTLDLSGFDPTGVTDYTDILKVTADTQITLKGASDAFINAVAPLLEAQNRYLGTVKVTAKVTLTGKTLAADQFTFKLYENSINAENLIKTSKNTASGSIDFGTIKIRDITKKVKLIAVQTEEDGYNNKTGNLTVNKTINLKTDGSLEVAAD
ncbi:MAG: hypothetical protein IJ641_07180 [Lachnospiraceae bacterium]|nr:hypothetical protein [Lachnospiraceae bacterium]